MYNNRMDCVGSDEIHDIWGITWAPKADEMDVAGMVDTARIALEQRKRGFRLFSAAREFVRGWDAYHSYDTRTAMDAFKRVVSMDPENPYGLCYLLFTMEDQGGYTVQQLADMAARWHVTAEKYRYQGQDAMAIMSFSRYIKKLEQI
jgi:hypothetical protein